MKLNKDSTIKIRVNSALKRKFEVAKGFLQASEVFGMFMQDYIREFEKQYGVIPISLDAESEYDIVTKMFGVQLTRKRFNDYHEIYPKTRNNKSVRGVKRNV